MKGQYEMDNVKETTKYYWLKLERGFFKRHDITIIENYGGYPDGQLMVNLYIRLLTESIDHNGDLRFSDEKPYNNRMLSALTGLSIDIVDMGMQCFQDFDLVEVLEDGTIVMKRVEKMLGIGSSTDRVREWRRRQKENGVDEQKTTTKKGTKTTPVVKKSPIMANDELFNQFWAVYPKKVGKDKCQNWFKIRNITQEFVDDLVSAIEQQKRSEQWQKNGNQFIPNPYTWLNRGGWNDELEYKEEPQVKISRRWENFLNE
jgi:predicted phage replisome organizer